MKPTILSFGNHKPRIAADVFVAHTAAVIGDVEVGEGSGIWFGCTLRGDGNLIKIGKRTNIQDGTVIHVNHSPEGMERGAHGYATIIGARITIAFMPTKARSCRWQAWIMARCPMVTSSPIRQA